MKSAQALPLPPLAEGEIYVGAIGDAVGNLYHLVLLPHETKANWKDAMAWAESQGGVLPNRVESAMLFAHCQQEFREDWYWTGEEHSSEPAWAWFQLFDTGYQLSNHKSFEGRARAVRRLPI